MTISSHTPTEFIAVSCLHSYRQRTNSAGTSGAATSKKLSRCGRVSKEMGWLGLGGARRGCTRSARRCLLGKASRRRIVTNRRSTKRHLDAQPENRAKVPKVTKLVLAVRKRGVLLLSLFKHPNLIGRSCWGGVPKVTKPTHAPNFCECFNCPTGLGSRLEPGPCRACVGIWLQLRRSGQ